MVLTGPLAAFAAVLCASGVMKLRHAEASLPSLAAVGLPARRGAVLGLGAAELAIGVTALVWAPAPVAGLVAVWYLALAAVSRRLVRRGAGPAGADLTCGCFGGGTTPPHMVQTIANTLCAAGAGAAALVGARALLPTVAASPGSGAVLALQVAIGALGVVAVHRDLPAALSRRAASPSFRLHPTR